MSRRKFLRDGLGLLLAVPAAWAQTYVQQPSQSVEIQALCSLKPASQSAARLGQMYLSLHPEQRNPQRLAEQIFSGWSESECQRALAAPEVLQAMLNAKIRQDFRVNNVASLDGWVLSATELQQWALLSLAS